MCMQPDATQHQYENYDKDFVHTPEQTPPPIETFDTVHAYKIPETPVAKTSHPFLKIISGLIILAIVALLAGAYYTYTAFTEPVTLSQNPLIIDIPKGASLQKVTDTLAYAGIIRSPFIFRSSMILAGFDASIKTGEYTFVKPVTMSEVIERLVTGDYQYIPVKFTIREGEDARTIYTNLTAQFPKLQATSTLLDILVSREGKLFPETYTFPPFATQDLILKTIDAEYQKRISAYKTDIASSTYSELQILTIASILEREVPKKEDMRIVAGIIYNRLAENMPLQMDSTLGYVTGKGSLQLTTEDLQADSPYNTYTNKGIPPAPIGNPGDASIDAALHPETHQYIFFLSDADGVNHYAVTYAEHLKNRKKYLGK